MDDTSVVEVSPEEVERIRRSLQKRLKEMKETERQERIHIGPCRFCQSVNVRVLSSNGIMGPGYRAYDYVCRDCGRIQ